MTIFVTILLMAILPLVSWAETAPGIDLVPPGGLTVDQAVKQAITANLGLKGERLKLGIKQRDRDLSFNKLYPAISVGAGLVRLNETTSHVIPVSTTVQIPAIASVPYAGASVTGRINSYTPDAWNLAGSLNAQLSISVATFAAIDQAATDYANSRISYEQAQQKLTRDVRKIFYQLLVLQENIKLTQRQLDNAEERYKQAQINFKAGQAPELSVLQAQVVWENRKPLMEDLRVNYSQLIFGFETTLGLPLTADLKLAGSLDVAVPITVPPAQDLSDRYVDKRLDMQAATGQLRFAEGAQRLLDSQVLPSIIVQFSADPTLNKPFDSSTKWDFNGWVEPSGALAILLSWKLDSIIPGSTSAMQRADAQDQAAIARNGVEQLRQAAKSEVVTLVQKIRKSLDAFKSLSQNVEVARRAYQLTEDAYKSGAKSLLEVEDAELQYQAAQLLLLNEKQLYISNTLDLETALNTPVEEIYGTK